MNGYEPVERDEVIQSVISNMIWLEDSFGLSRVWYIRDLGCPFVLYTAFGKDWDLMSQMCIYIYLYSYTYVMIWISAITYDMMCTGFVFMLGIIHWACGCSTPPFIPFSPRCDYNWWHVDLYCIMRFIQIKYMYFRLDVCKC